MDTTGRVMSDWWLSYWADMGEQGETKNSFYLTIYLSALSFSIAFVMVKTVLVAYLFSLSGFVVLSTLTDQRRGALKAAKVLHEGMLNHVLHAPMSFFDTTPLGKYSLFLPSLLNYFNRENFESIF